MPSGFFNNGGGSSSNAELRSAITRADNYQMQIRLVANEFAQVHAHAHIAGAKLSAAKPTKH